MESEAYTGPVPNARGDESRPPELTMARRRELIKLADALATDLTGKVKQHELCFLRQAVEMFIGSRY